MLQCGFAGLQNAQVEVNVFSDLERHFVEPNSFLLGLWPKSLEVARHK